MFPKWREGWRVHSKQTIYTSEPFNNNPREKEWTTHEEREFEKKNKKNKHFKHERATIPPHVQNTLSLQYTSGKTTKTTTKKDNQNHVCILLHREALSVIRCVLLQAYSYWYLLQSREKRKRSTLSSNGNPLVYILTLQCGAKGLCHWFWRNRCFRIRIVLKWGITKAYTEAL